MKVAVVVPCFNVQAHVEAALASVLMQTHADLDVVAVDDGSTDGTREVLERVARRDPRVRVIVQPNRGAGAARNAGIAATEGEWIQFLDADDVLLPDKIERQLRSVGAGIDLIIGGYRNRYVDGRAEADVLPLQGDPWEALVRTRMGTTSADLFRRSALIAAGGWAEELRSSQDYELLFRMLRGGASIAWDMEVGCLILKRAEGSISRTDERSNWLRYIALRQAMRDHLVAKHPDRVGVIATADQYLFMAIRVLSKHDRAAAFEAYDRILPKDFVPERSQATTAAYVLVHRLLGFRTAERLAAL